MADNKVSRTFVSREIKPSKPHLVRSGEVWDLRKDVDYAVSILERELIIPVSFGFGAMMPDFPPNPRPGEYTYGICNSLGPLAALRHIYLWTPRGDVKRIEVDTNIFIYLEVDQSGSALGMDVGLYRALDSTPNWVAVGGSSGGVPGHIINDGSSDLPQTGTLEFTGMAAMDGGFNTTVRFPIVTTSPAERNALQSFNGLTVWATDLGSLVVYNNGVWSTT